MVTAKEIRENYEEYKKVLEKRYLFEFIPILDKIKSLDEVWRKNLKDLERLRHERNNISKKISELKKRGEKVNDLILEARKIDAEVESLERGVKELEREIKEYLKLLPNWINEKVPVGPNEDYNVAIKYWGKPKVYREWEKDFKFDTEYEVIDWKPLHHYDLVEKFGLADTIKAGEIAGARFYFEKNELVFLDMALTLYAIEFFYKKGFKNVLIPPYMMKREIEEYITHLDTFIDAIYSIKDEDLVLIPTSEHPICAYYKDYVFEKKDLPLRILAWSPAFRREAGAHGKDTKGLFRTHQFHKTELHSITEKEKDMEELNYLVKIVEEFMQTLEIPYRVVLLSSGDMDKRALIQYDIEAWFPAQNKYRETHSIATIGTWVSEKMNIKINKGGKREFVSNLYATGAANQRLLLALMVNNYDPKKEVIKIPSVLHKYLPFKEILK